MTHQAHNEEMTQHPEWQDWMANWMFLGADGKYCTYEPDNTCLYAGKDLTLAIRSFKLSTFG